MRKPILLAGVMGGMMAAAVAGASEVTEPSSAGASAVGRGGTRPSKEVAESLSAGAPAGWEAIWAQFDSYDLPDLSAATYVNLRGTWDPRVEDLLPDGWNATGNAWLLEETWDEKGQPIRARGVADGSRVVAVRRSEEFSGGGVKKEASLEAPEPPGEILASGRWEPGDPGRDAQKGVEFLQSLKWEGEPGYGGFPEKLFLLARALWQRGDVEHAAALLAELAAREGGAERVARAAMNQVANGEYGNLYEAFRESHDWEAYRDGLRRLLEKYPEGWNAAPVMRMLLEKVEARMADSQPRPTTAGRMSEVDLRQAAAMMSVRVWRGGASEYDDPPVLWCAPSGWSNRVPEPRDAEMEIRVRGMEAVPFLLALMEEEDVLTDADRVEVSRAGPYRDRFHPEELERFWTEAKETLRQQMIRRGFDTMDRPATRGEVARRLLSDLIPEWVLGGSHRRQSKEDMMRAVQDFVKKYEGATDDGWAVLSLPGRYPFAFNKQAEAHVMEVARQRPVPELERFLLDEEWLVPGAREYDRDSAKNNKKNLLKGYAAIRGEEARPVLQAYADRQRRKADELEARGTASLAAEEAEQVNAQIAGLRETAREFEEYEFPSLAPKDAVLVEGRYDREVLKAYLAVAAPAEVPGAVLAHAVSIPEAEARLQVGYQFSQWVREKDGISWKPTEHVAEWEALMTDDRESPVAEALGVSELYLVLNEQMFAKANLPELPRGRYEYPEYSAGERAARKVLQDHGERGREWLRERVRKRLAGVPEEELPVYPIGMPPDEETFGRLREAFEAAGSREEAARLAEGLSLPERMALPEMLRRNPELNARLLEMANRIEAVMVDGDLGEWNRKLKEWEGQSVQMEWIDDLQRIAVERSQAEQSFNGKLLRRPDFGGYEVVAEATVPVPAYYAQRKIEQRISGYAGLVCGVDLYGAARWRTAPPPGEDTWWAVETSGPFEMGMFRDAAARFWSAGLPASEEAVVIFQTQGEKR